MSDEPERGTGGRQSGPPPGSGWRRLRRWAALPHRRAMQRHALLLLWLGTLALMLIVLLLQAVMYLEGPRWHEQVRRFAVQQLERSTGARVELDQVSWSLPRLEFDLDGLRIHGREAAGEAPLLRLEQAQIRLKWNALLAGRVALHEVRLVRPMVHVLVYPDGTTNLPQARPKRAAPSFTVEDFLRLAADRVVLSDGELHWNNRKIRLDGMATGVFVRVGYQGADRHYEGKLRVRELRLRMPRREPLSLSAEGEFRLYRNRLEIPQMRIQEAHGWVEVGGAVDGFASPVAQFSYRAACETDELARLLGTDSLRGGMLRASGEGSYRWDRRAYALTGKARAEKLGWVNPSVHLEDVSGGIHFSLKPGSFHVSSLFAVALGGTVHGNLEIRTAAGQPTEGQASLQVDGVELHRTLGAFSRAKLPLHRLPLSGSTSGTLALRWRGPVRNALMDADLSVTPRYRPGGLALSAAVQASVNFRQETVEVQRLDAETQFTRLSGQGRLSPDSDFRFDLEAASLAELEPMVVAWRGSRAQDLPIDFSGRASFRGSLQGELRSPTLAGHLELHDFTTNVLVPSVRAPRKGERAASAAAPRRLRTRWDLLEGEVQYSSSGESIRHGLLRRGKTSVEIDASLGLANGAYDRRRPFTAHVQLRDISAGELQKLAGSHYPITGTVSGELQLSGGNAPLRGSGRIALRNAAAWQQAVSSATASIDLAGDEVQLHHIVLTSDAMRLTGQARIDAATRAFAFHLQASQVRLEKLHALQSRGMPIHGRAALELSGSGTPAAPIFNGSLHLTDLAVGRQKFGDMDVDAATHGAEMTLKARSRFSAMEMNLAGQVELRDGLPLRIRGDLHSAKLNSLLAAYLPVRLSGPSELQAHFDLSGEAMHPKDLAAEITVERIATSYGDITVNNQDPIRLKVEHRVLQVEELRLSGEKGAHLLRVRGNVHLDGQRAVDLRADGSVNLSLLQTADPDLMSSGAMSLHMRVTGTLHRPVVRGQLTVKNGAIAYIDFPNGLSDINGTLIFNEDRLQLQELTARTGGGLLHCSGFLNYVPSQGVGFNLTAEGQDIRLRYPRGLSSTANANLTLSGTTKYALLSGTVTVTRLGVNRQFDFASYLRSQSRAAPVQTTESPLSKIRLDVHVISTPELQVQTSLARLSGNLDLRVRGTAFRPVVLGRVNLLEGTLEFNGTQYKMERGDVTFSNPVRIEPNLDVELSTRVRDFDLTLGLHGPLDKLRTTYRSDPPLSSSDIISLLALGRTTEEQANPAMMGTAQYQPSVSDSASMALLGQALNATVSSRVQKLFGVSRVKIDPNVGGAVNTSLARVTVEQQISNKLTLTYISNLNQSAQQIIQFEYNLEKNVTIVGVRDQTGVVSFDVVLRKRIR